MHRATVKRAWTALLTLALWGCTQTPGQVTSEGGGVGLAGPGPAASEKVPLHSERAGIGLQQWEAPPDQVRAQLFVPTDTRRSLAVTDKVILNSFPLRAVLDQLVAQNGGTGFTTDQLFRQLWDTQNPAPGEPDLPASPHCTDQGGQLNGFPYPCRPGPGSEGGQSPQFGASARVDDYIAIGLFNRFDLAPTDGSDCGEYRVVYAKRPGVGPGRNFIIFEAVLPNPRQDLGLEGCRRVADFWSNLSDPALPMSTLQSRLKDFYFLGLPGFAPVFHFSHYGDASGKGQVRTNQFMSGPWLLREFKLQQFCGAPPCTLKFTPVTDKTNPFGDLFNPGSGHPLAPDFQTVAFPSQVAALAINDINAFNYEVQDRFNVGQSDAQSFGTVDDYLLQFGGLSPFHNTIQQQLNRLGSGLTPQDIVARAQALSCGGCHQRSNGQPMGAGLVWPNSLGFVHNSEFDDPANPARFDISDALRFRFLPHRRQVLEGFLLTPGVNAGYDGMAVPSTVAAGSNFSVTVTMRNTGTTAWTETNKFRLGSQGPANNFTWGPNRVLLAPGETIHRGQAKSFTFNVQAPAAPGGYVFQWQMVHDAGPGFFGGMTPPVNINVQ